MYGIIYKIENKLNGNIYIGQTTQSLKKRKIQHISNSNKTKRNMSISKALNKYGPNYFSWKKIYECNSPDELDKKEIYYIKHYNSYKNGYNSTTGGNISKNYNPMFDPEIKKKAIKSLKIVMKKFTGDNNVMKIPEVKQKHLESMQKLSKDPEYKKAKSIGDLKQKHYYEITDSLNNKFTIHGLNEFCKQNNLSQSKMSSVNTGNRQHHKGYKCKRIYPDNIEVSKNYFNNKSKKMKNKNAKHYKIITPNNEKIEIFNLTLFCKKNNLAYTSMLAVSSGKQKQHKGYKCFNL